MRKIYIFVSLLIFSQSAVNASPSFGDEHYENDQYNNYLEAGELLLEINKIDINDRGLYEGYFLNFTNSCEAAIKLKPYSSQIRNIKVNICKKIPKLKSLSSI